jgi:hypothetical protein
MKKKSRARKQERDLFEMSESDEEYFPDEESPKEELGKRQDIKEVSKNTKELFKELQEETQANEAKKLKKLAHEKSFSEEEKLKRCYDALAELNKQIKPSKEGLIHFAGKLYKLNEKGELEEAGDQDVKKGFEELQKLANKYTTENPNAKNSQQKERNIEEKEYRQLLIEKKGNLKTLIGLLNNRHRNVSAIFKSKIDWKRFTSVNQIDKQLEHNRKDGFIEKQKFLMQTQASQKKP